MWDSKLQDEKLPQEKTIISSITVKRILTLSQEKTDKSTLPNFFSNLADFKVIWFSHCKLNNFNSTVLLKLRESTPEHACIACSTSGIMISKHENHVHTTQNHFKLWVSVRARMLIGFNFVFKVLSLAENFTWMEIFSFFSSGWRLCFDFCFLCGWRYFRIGL